MTALLLTAAAAAVASLAGPSIAAGRDDNPFDPRDHLDPPTLPADAENPLDLVSSRLQQPDDVLFTVRSDEPLTTRLIALDSFDGAGWKVGGSWVEAGSRITPEARPDAESRTVRAEIEIPDTGLQGPFLPSVGDTVRVGGVSAIVEPGSGSLALTGGDVAGRSYTLEGDLASLANLDGREFTSLPAGTGPEADLATALPAPPPPELVESANAATAGRTTPMEQATAISDFFRRGGFTLAEEPRSGNAYYHILQTLGVTLEGTSEQYAAAFAVYGRIVGLPTRLVVGFRAGTETAPGEYTVRAGDAIVWPEVMFDGVGWIAFNPTPDEQAESAEDAGASVDVGDREVLLSPATTVPRRVEPVAPAATPTPVTAEPDDEGGNGWLTIAVVAVAAVAAAVVLAAGVIVLLKRRRTSRRRRGEPRQRVLGAWHDILDRLAESGGTPAGGRTVEEHVRDNERVDPALAGVYRPVVRALYGREPLDADDATKVWTARDRFVKARRNGVGAITRIKRAVAVGPLLHPSADRAGSGRAG